MNCFVSPEFGAPRLDYPQRARASQRNTSVDRNCTEPEARSLELRVVHLLRLLQIDCMTTVFFRRGLMSVKAMMATILKDQMTLRGVNSLSPSDYEQIVEQLRELELSLAAREVTDKREP